MRKHAWQLVDMALLCRRCWHPQDMGQPTCMTMSSDSSASCRAGGGGCALAALYPASLQASVSLLLLLVPSPVVLLAVVVAPSVPGRGVAPPAAALLAPGAAQR